MQQTHRKLSTLLVPLVLTTIGKLRRVPPDELSTAEFSETEIAKVGISRLVSEDNSLNTHAGGRKYDPLYREEGSAAERSQMRIVDSLSISKDLAYSRSSSIVPITRSLL
ncbi:hypothetical protein EJ08DRAFT_665869 [Tothia fuscella]|uniref:Uncharacterized protein n=1 Tax=Tothia fuscella TaxID=1048955 RepID=A0A9P4NFK9_9PEZI|nr:hypothetical protein EJ08DRAFT_665869 [Tothia fuscella]